MASSDNKITIPASPSTSSSISLLAFAYLEAGHVVIDAVVKAKNKKGYSSFKIKAEVGMGKKRIITLLRFYINIVTPRLKNNYLNSYCMPC